jgi:hypothetical protein
LSFGLILDILSELWHSQETTLRRLVAESIPHFVLPNTAELIPDHIRRASLSEILNRLSAMRFKLTPNVNSPKIAAIVAAQCHPDIAVLLQHALRTIHLRGDIINRRLSQSFGSASVPFPSSYRIQILCEPSLTSRTASGAIA